MLKEIILKKKRDTETALLNSKKKSMNSNIKYPMQTTVKNW